MNRNQENLKRKKKSGNQSVYIAAVAVLMVISVLIAVVSASNRKKPTELTPPAATATAPAPQPKPTTDKPIPKPTLPSVTTPATNAKPTEDATSTGTVTPPKTDTPVIAPLPEFGVPADGIVAKDHSGSTPVFSVTMNDYRVHQGIDVQGAVGDPVFATADGTISQIWDDPMMGKCLSLSHTGGAVSIYKNLADELAASATVGAMVKRGDVIGAIGESAIIEIAEEPHVHYELKIDNKQVDPEEYIDFSDASVDFDE